MNYHHFTTSFIHKYMELKNNLLIYEQIIVYYILYKSIVKLFLNQNRFNFNKNSF